jgi:hypothetical protein
MGGPTVLIYKKHFLNDMNELVFQFDVYHNVYTNTVCSHRYDGDVMINCHNKSLYASPNAMRDLKDAAHDEVVNNKRDRLLEIPEKERLAYIEKEVEALIKDKLLKKCEEIKAVIG